MPEPGYLKTSSISSICPLISSGCDKSSLLCKMSSFAFLTNHTAQMQFLIEGNFLKLSWTNLNWWNTVASEEHRLQAMSLSYTVSLISPVSNKPLYLCSDPVMCFGLCCLVSSVFLCFCSSLFAPASNFNKKLHPKSLWSWRDTILNWPKYQRCLGNDHNTEAHLSYFSSFIDFYYIFFY